ncbi:hypothetical protein N9X01_02120 [Candidatus Pelagibacter bacterium]|nr:hypothetical protein [Candidatus Pelagibacter bacterium]
MKILKYIHLVIFFILFQSNLFAATTLGAATEYKITIKKIELCGAGSTISDCVGPITIFSGNSGLIDIASTAAGTAAATLGDVSAAPLGASYSVVQVTMDRKVTLKGTVTVGSNTCSTIANNASSQILNGKGTHDTTGDEAAGVYYMGEALGSDMGAGDALNFIAADGSVSADDDNSLADPGNVDIMHRTVLTAPVTITLGRLPTVKIAFGTTAAIGWGYGAAGTAGHCTSSSNATGLFGAEPSVVITFQ